jgi:hypothetical protein
VIRARVTVYCSQPAEKDIRRVKEEEMEVTGILPSLASKLEIRDYALFQFLLLQEEA